MSRSKKLQYDFIVDDCNSNSISRVYGRQDLVTDDIAYMRFLVDKTLLQNTAYMRFLVDKTLLQIISRTCVFWFSFDICPQYYACLGTPCCQSTRFRSTCVKSSFVLSPVLLPQLLTCVWHSNLLRVSRRVEGCERRT